MRRRGNHSARGRFVLLVVAVGSLALGACSAPKSTGDTSAAAAKACDVGTVASPTTVNILAYSAPSIDPFSDSMVKGCKSVANLTINHTPVDFTGQLQKADLALASGGKSPYDIVEVYNGSLVEYASKGWVVPLDSYIAKYRDSLKLADIPASAWDGLSYKGKVYGIPNQINTQILIYRKDLFDKLKIPVPTDYATYLAAAQKLKGSVDYPLALAWGADDAIFDGFHMWLTAGGGKWFNTNNSPAFDSAQGRKALTEMKQLYPYMPKDSLTFGNGDVMGLFQQGKVGMTTIWVTRAGPITDPTASKVADKVAFAPAPKGLANEGSAPASETSVDGFALAKKSGVDPETLFRIVASTTTNVDVQKAASTVVIPSRTSLQKDPGLAKPAWAAALTNFSAGAKPLPPLPFVEPLSKSVINPFLAKGVSGALGVTAALNQASAALTTTLTSQNFIK